MVDPEHSSWWSSESKRENERLPEQVKREERRPAEIVRPITMGSGVGSVVDERIVKYPLYNSFNYSLFLPSDYKTIRISLGITSPNLGEGKTTAVCNLATAIALGTGRKTIVVDSNLRRPRVHEIFGIPRGPGLGEALMGGEICVVPTQIENLFVLPAGKITTVSNFKIPSFRELLSSLFTEFEFVLVDMPSVAAGNFPTLIANQLTGLVVVVKQKKTKRKDIARLFRRVRKETILGFVMNEVNENDF